MEIYSRPKEGHVDVISATISIACDRVSSLNSMKGLVHVADKVNQELKRLSAVRFALRRVAQDLFRPCYLGDHTVAVLGRLAVACSLVAPRPLGTIDLCPSPR